MVKNYTVALTIAGSDSGGGAGIQADVKTFSALGCFATTVITAVTAQNTMGVRAVQPIDVAIVEAQLRAVLEDMPVRAIKVGMLFSAGIINAVAEVLADYRHIPLVLDPVMIAQSGDALIQDDAIQAMQQKLFPLTTLLTPNLPEAQRILGYLPNKPEQTLIDWHRLRLQAVLLKGGHRFDSELSTDYLLLPESKQVLAIEAPRIPTQNTHGTGCTLSSAIAAFLAQGYELAEACRCAKQYLHACLEAGKNYQLGKGAGPVHHFHTWW